MLRGGYLSWLDTASDTWWQETWFGGDSPTFRSLGQLSARNGSIRGRGSDRLTFKETSEAVAPGRRVARGVGVPVHVINQATTSRASSLRRQIEMITGQSSDRSGDRMPMEADGGQRTSGGRPGRRRAMRGNGKPTDGLRAIPSVLPERSSSAH